MIIIKIDDKPDIKLNYKKIKSNRGKEYYIERDKYILNLNYITKTFYVNFIMIKELNVQHTLKLIKMD